MAKIWMDIPYAVSSILRNKMTSVFTILVSFFICVFLNVILQMANTVYGDNPPFSNADRIVHLSTGDFQDSDGRALPGIYGRQIPAFLKSLRNAELTGVSNTEVTLVSVGDNVFPSDVGFVSGSYWEMNDFLFVEGRGFSADEAGDGAKKAVITDEIAEKYFGKGSVVGKNLEVQGLTYEVIGVVRNYSDFSSMQKHINVWLTSANTKFLPSGLPIYDLEILFKSDVPPAEFKQDVLYALQSFYQKQNKDLALTANGILTVKESRIAKFDDEGGLYVGIGLIIVLLLLIPLVNVITLNESGIQSRIDEFSIRRAVGATKWDIVGLVVTENLILVFVGFLLGFVLTDPIVNGLEKIFFSTQDRGVTILAGGVPLWNILATGLFAILFSLISGGVPAWYAMKKGISSTMKGGDNG